MSVIDDGISSGELIGSELSDRLQIPHSISHSTVTPELTQSVTFSDHKEDIQSIASSMEPLTIGEEDKESFELTQSSELNNAVSITERMIIQPIYKLLSEASERLEKEQMRGDQLGIAVAIHHISKIRAFLSTQLSGNTDLHSILTDVNERTVQEMSEDGASFVWIGSEKGYPKMSVEGASPTATDSMFDSGDCDRANFASLTAIEAYQEKTGKRHDNIVDDQPERSRGIYCEICKSNFVSSAALRAHMMNPGKRHDGLEDDNPENVRGIYCEICHQSNFVSSAALQAHKENPGKRHDGYVNNKPKKGPHIHCKVCHRTNFASKDALQAHMMNPGNQHSRPKYPCTCQHHRLIITAVVRGSDGYIKTVILRCRSCLREPIIVPRPVDRKLL